MAQFISDKKGSFVQGDIGTLMVRITNFDGEPVDPSEISLSINRELTGLAVITSASPEKIDTGFYLYEWNISSSQTVGDYIATWTYTVDDEESSEIQYVVVSALGTGTTLLNQYTTDFIRLLEGYIPCAQNIPVYFEQARPTTDYRTYEFSFKNWNQNPKIRVYRNKQLIVSGFEVDYFNGKIVFDEALTDYDSVYADYNFKWFTEDQLLSYIENALKQINVAPPFKTWGLNMIFTNQEASQYSAGVLYGAAKDAIRTLMMCLQFQTPQEVFGGSEAAGRAFSNMETLKENYEKSFNQIIENKKFGKYPRMRMVVVPSYALPGGRSRWFRYLFGTGS